LVNYFALFDLISFLQSYFRLASLIHPIASFISAFSPMSTKSDVLMASPFKLPHSTSDSKSSNNTADVKKKPESEYRTLVSVRCPNFWYGDKELLYLAYHKGKFDSQHLSTIRARLQQSNNTDFQKCSASTGLIFNERVQSSHASSKTREDRFIELL